MYGWIWRRLPGDARTKAVWSLVLVAVAVGVLWFGVFPRVEARLRFDNAIVESGTPSPSPSRTAPSPSPGK